MKVHSSGRRNNKQKSQRSTLSLSQSRFARFLFQTKRSNGWDFGLPLTPTTCSIQNHYITSPSSSFFFLASPHISLFFFLIFFFFAPFLCLSFSSFSDLSLPPWLPRKRETHRFTWPNLPSRPRDTKVFCPFLLIWDFVFVFLFLLFWFAAFLWFLDGVCDLMLALVWIYFLERFRGSVGWVMWMESRKIWFWDVGFQLFYGSVFGLDRFPCVKPPSFCWFMLSIVIDFHRLNLVFW